MSDLLRLLKAKERLWANCSGRSWQMSDRERFAQVAHDKWVNERFTQKFWLKKSKILFFSMFYIRFFYLKNERFAHSLFFGEQCEQIAKVAHQKLAMWANPSGRSLKMSNNKRFAQVAHKKWGTMSESLRSLTKNEWLSESLVYLSKSLLRSFFRKKPAIRSENQWANSQPWFQGIIQFLLFKVIASKWFF